MVSFLAAFKFNWYGFLIALGIIAGTICAYFAAKKRGYNPDVVFDIIIWALPFAIIGARLYYVIFDIIGSGAKYTFPQALGFYDDGFRLQGLAIYGGVLGALLGVFFNSLMYKHKEKKTGEKKETFLMMCDIGSPFLILGQAIGRWGNFANAEVYGQPVLNPAYQFFPIAVKVDGMWYQALFFYESMLNLIGFGLLLWFLLGRRRSFPGFVFACYGIYYGIVRIILESFRDKAQFVLYMIPNVLPVSQFVSAIAIILGAAGIIYVWQKAQKEGKKPPILVHYDDWEKTGLPEEIYGKPLLIDEYEYVEADEEESVQEYLEKSGKDADAKPKDKD
ncbi:MAG TPA: prolipoprotein diacylglyceryl transferase [Clostridiales bacterium]|jgi:phosphatidylglycerol:prolipoprotein diacylglycerol transferase|nr:prolipoprotein diacylglyceryl transferase [Clostridiales bacterium]